METINVEQIKNIVTHIADTVIQNEKYFCDLDAATGDGGLWYDAGKRVQSD